MQKGSICDLLFEFPDYKPLVVFIITIIWNSIFLHDIFDEFLELCIVENRFILLQKTVELLSQLMSIFIFYNLSNATDRWIRKSTFSFKRIFFTMVLVNIAGLLEIELLTVYYLFSYFSVGLLPNLHPCCIAYRILS